MIPEEAYLMATCDFSNVMIWAFKKARKHRMSLVEMGRGGDSNFFTKMAEKEVFRHATNPNSFPRGITRDEARLGWLIINKHNEDSAFNLVYILSSIIK